MSGSLIPSVSGFATIFEGEDDTGGVPMGEVPELPPRDVETPALIPWQEAARRSLQGEILSDRIRLPEDDIVVPKTRHTHVWIESGIFPCLLFTFPQVDKMQAVVQLEVIGDCHCLEGSWARRKDIEFDAHGCSLLRRSLVDGEVDRLPHENVAGIGLERVGQARRELKS
jgi:hypothetical protein